MENKTGIIIGLTAGLIGVTVVGFFLYKNSKKTPVVDAPALTLATLAAPNANVTSFIKSMEGKAVKINGRDEIYMIQGGKKRWISSLAKYNEIGSPNVTTISAEQINYFPNGINF